MEFCLFLSKYVFEIPQTICDNKSVHYELNSHKAYHCTRTHMKNNKKKLCWKQARDLDKAWEISGETLCVSAKWEKKWNSSAGGICGYLVAQARMVNNFWVCFFKWKYNFWTMLITRYRSLPVNVCVFYESFFVSKG